MSIRVRIDYLPSGDESRAQPLAEVRIENSKSGHYALFDHPTADYLVRVDGKEKAPVLGHRRSAGFWQLVRRAINAVTP